MSIVDRLTDAEPAFSFEFFPPQTADGENALIAALGELRDLGPDYVSVTYGAGGSTQNKTVELTMRIADEFGFEAMAHFTCVNSTVADLRAVLDDMRDAGIRNVLALRGDPPNGGDRWAKTDGGLEYSRELVELIRADYDFTIAAACFPEVHIDAVDSESDLAYLKAKVDAGVDFLITQLFFDNDLYYDFVARARAAGIEVPIVPGIWPITGYAQIARVSAMCGATLPANLLGELEARKGDEEAVRQIGVAYATMQTADLLANGAPGAHFYTLNRSPATRAILSTLRLWRPWDRSQTGLGAPRSPSVPA